MIRDPEDVANDAREMLMEIKERKNDDIAPLSKLLDRLNDQVYQLDASITSHEEKGISRLLLCKIATTIELMLYACK